MTYPEKLGPRIGRSRVRRLEQIKRWAEYVRTHPDEDWGEQVNTIVGPIAVRPPLHFGAGGA